MNTVVWINAQPRDPATAAPVELLLAGGGQQRSYRHPASGEQYRAGVVRRPLYSARLGFGREGFDGVTRPNTAEISFSTADRALREQLRAFVWDSAAIVIETGAEGSVPAVEFSGTVKDASFTRGEMRLTVVDLIAKLDKPVASGRFAGTGGIEGPEEAAGRIKRRSFGRVFNVEGRLLDAANSIYEFGDPAFGLTAWTALRDKGRNGPITELAWQGSIAATFAALQASAPASGGGVVAPSIACAKWWTQPAGPLTADFTGTAGAGGSLAVAALADAISALGGGPAVAALVDAIALRPGDAGIHIATSGESFAQAIDRLMLGVSLVWVPQPDGTISLRPWIFDGAAPVLQGEFIGRERTFPPHGRRRVGYRRNERIHSDGEIAAVLLELDLPDAALNVNQQWGQISGAGKPADYADVTASNTAAAIAGQGPGATAPADDVLNYGSTDGLVIARPGGATLSSLSSSSTGAIRIDLPVSWSSNMMRFQVEIFNYATGQSITYFISGYNWSGSGSGGRWVNQSAQMIGPATMGHTVRFGSKNGKCAIWIGETNSTWAYLRVRVINFTAHVSNPTVAQWNTGWAIGLDTNAAVNESGDAAVVMSVTNPRAADAVFGISTFETVGGTAATLPNFKTSQGTAAAITGQTAWATFSAPTARLNNLSDSGVFNSLANITTRNLNQLNSRAWTNLYRANGTTAITDGDAITALGTAAAITGQGLLATKSAVDLASGEVTNKSLANLDAVADANLKKARTALAGALSAQFNPENYDYSIGGGPLPSTNLADTAYAGFTLTTDGRAVDIGPGQYQVGLLADLPLSDGMIYEFLWVVEILAGSSETSTWSYFRCLDKDLSLVTSTGVNGSSQSLVAGQRALTRVRIGKGVASSQVDVLITDPSVVFIRVLPLVNRDPTSTLNNNSAHTRFFGITGTVDYVTGTPLTRLTEDGSTAVTLPNFKTSLGIASGFSGQTAWATYSAPTARLNNLSDSGVFNSLANITTRNLSLLNGRAWTNLYRANGTTAITDGDAITALGTAAAISGQGPGATAPADDVLNYGTATSTTRIAAPSGGTFSQGGASVTGAIKIRLPVAFTNTMLRFTVDVFDYSTDKMQTYLIGGYTFSGSGDGGFWNNVSAHLIGGEKTSKTVTFGNDGTNACIWIGTPGATWGYPKVVVRDAIASHVGYDANTWKSGWGVSVDTGGQGNPSPLGNGTVRTVTKPRASDAVFGENVFEAGSGSTATLPNFKTSQGTAAAIAGQAPAATDVNIEPAADVTKAITGPTSLDINYDSTGTISSTLPITATFKLQTAAGSTVTSGVTWAVATESGTWSGTAPSIAGSGTGVLSLNSGLNTNTAVIKLTANYFGKTYSFAVTINKKIAPAGSSGGGGNDFASDTTLVATSTTSFVTVSGELIVTTQSGSTEVDLTAASITLYIAAGGPEGITVVEGKWQWWNGSSWVDVAAAVTSSPHPSVINEGTEFEPNYWAVDGAITVNQTKTGLTANTEYKFRLMGRCAGGYTRTVGWSGTASAQG